jgi:hypothetical protein
LPCSLFGTYSPQERSCCPRVQWLRMGCRPRFHELVPVYVQSARDSAKMSIYLSQLTCELWHPTLVFLLPWTRSPTVLPTSRPLAYQTPSMLPEGGACSSFSLECVHLGAYLSWGSPQQVTDPCYRADVDLDIPAIAVIGWQSAGKSSLIEAISGITLPRASGTCTR